MRKRLASLSLDLDNKWSYLKTHGDPDWESFPSYLPLVVPRILEYFHRYRVTATVFVVGQDAALQQHRTILRSLADAGHEIGNHSFHHDPWLHCLTSEELLEEIIKAEAAIQEATGKRPQGFRGPGYSRSAELYRVLAERGYDYDASVFPTFLGPVARLYYFLRSSLNRAERAQRKQLFGNFRDGFQPLRPYAISTPSGTLLEIPVTTIPIVRLPFHLSYIHYLAQYSEALGVAYFSMALRCCRGLGVEPSILLHPLDFLGRDDVPELHFFPGMQRSSKQKESLMHRIMDTLQRSHEIVSMKDHATAALARTRAGHTRLQENAVLSYD